MLPAGARFRWTAVAVALSAGLAWPPGLAWSAAPRNTILFIGDGMGFEQVRAAGMYLNGAEGTLSFESLPFQGEVRTFSADNPITDSAASGTAIATGHKANNGVISMALPGDGSELETMLEFLQSRGRRSGLVTTTYLTHATPACFGAHEPSRGNTTQIAGDYLNQTRPHLLFGGGGYGMTAADATAAGYAVVTDCTALQSIDPDTATRVSALFGYGHLPYEYDGPGSYCHLSEMTAWAIDMLEEVPDGFFLMVEGGRIDHAGHSNDLVRNIFETIEFAATVQVAIDWAAGRNDTLIIVTADHETGGLIVDENNGAGYLPDVRWTTTGHTGVNVPIYAWGVNADLVGGVMDNTDIIEVVLAGPKISVSPTEWTRETIIGSPLPDDSFTIQNTGHDTLNYTVTSDVDWLLVDPASGSSSGEPDTISVTYDLDELNVGIHSGYIRVESVDAIDSPQTVTVTLVVEPVPGDFDLDRDVDQEDFGHLQACFTGPAKPQDDPDCQDAMLDSDNDVDEDDLTIFQACLAAPNVPADPLCAP